MSPWGKVQKVYVHHMREYDDKSVKLIDNELTAEEYIELSAAVEFYKPSLGQTKKALENSLLTVKAVCDGKVVGMGRLIGDGAMYWFIQEVCILPEYQGLGIGKGIVNRMITFVEQSCVSGERVTIQLMAAKGKEEFYKKLGFVSRPNEYSGAGMQKRFVIK